MGVVANLRPDLFRAVVADVPFVDVINTMLDASIPLTAQEWEQWGNPAQPRALRLHEELLAVRQRGGEGISRACSSRPRSTTRR